MTPLRPGHDLALLSSEDFRAFRARWFQRRHLWPSHHGPNFPFWPSLPVCPCPCPALQPKLLPDWLPESFRCLPASALSLAMHLQPGILHPTPQPTQRAFPAQSQAAFTKNSFLFHPNCKKMEFFIKIFIHARKVQSKIFLHAIPPTTITRNNNLTPPPCQA